MFCFHLAFIFRIIYFLFCTLKRGGTSFKNWQFGEPYLLMRSTHHQIASPGHRILISISLIPFSVEEVHWKVRNLSKLFSKSVKGEISIKTSPWKQYLKYVICGALWNILKILYESNERVLYLYKYLGYKEIICNDCIAS